MDMNWRVHMPPEQQAGGGPDVTARRAVMLLCVALLILAVVAPLLLTFPKKLDAAVGPVGAATDAAANEAAPVPFHEQYPIQSSSSWVDSLEQGELATWRSRASD